MTRDVLFAAPLLRGDASGFCERGVGFAMFAIANIFSPVPATLQNPINGGAA